MPDYIRLCLRSRRSDVKLTEFKHASKVSESSKVSGFLSN